MNDTKSFLPIECFNGLDLDQAIAHEIGDNLKSEYAIAEPFPHTIIDDFLPVEMAEKLLEHFPVTPKIHDKIYQKGYGGLNKRQISPDDCDEYVRSAFGFFNSAPILQFLEGITTISGLLPDPYYTGGGLHEISTGGLLGIHADFRVNESLQLLRRINLLIYLNKDWPDAYGGKLEIWDKEMTKKVKSVQPIFNRCVIFNTDENSFHGHPEPLTSPEGITRKSIALYYYTANKIKNNSEKSRHTLYVARPNDSKKTKADVKKLLKKREKRAKKHFQNNENKSAKQILIKIKEKLFKN